MWSRADARPRMFGAIRRPEGGYCALRSVFLLLAPGWPAALGGRLGLLGPAVLADQAEVELADLHAGLEDDDPGRVAQAVLAPVPLPGQRLADRVVRVVVLRQLGVAARAVAHEHV